MQTIGLDTMSILDKRPLNRAERRKQETRIKLLQATEQILEERGYHKFSIKAVTDLADVGYGTFYTHFENRDDAIWTVLLIHFEDVGNTVERTITTQLPSPQREIAAWRVFFGNIKQRRDEFEALFGEEGSIYLRYKFEEYTAETYKKNILAHNYQMPSAYEDLPIDYLAHFMAGAQLQLVRWWLKSDMTYTADDMANMLYRTIYHSEPD